MDDCRKAFEDEYGDLATQRDWLVWQQAWGIGRSSRPSGELVTSVDLSRVKRFDLWARIGEGGDPELAEDWDVKGEWVRFSDIEHLLTHTGPS